MKSIALVTAGPTREYLDSVRYISNADTVDVFETLRATTAVPILFDKEVCLQLSTLLFLVLLLLSNLYLSLH